MLKINKHTYATMKSVAVVSADSSYLPSRGIPMCCNLSRCVSAPRSHLNHHDVARELGCHPLHKLGFARSTLHPFFTESGDAIDYLATARNGSGGQCASG